MDPSLLVHDARRFAAGIASLSFALVLSACALTAEVPPVPARPTPEAPASLLAVSSPVTAETPTAVPPAPTGVLSLRDALAAALLGNPHLAAFSWEVRAREARTLQAGRLPNPELATEFEDFGGSGDRSGWQSAQSTLSLSQLVELGGQRAKRRRVAALEQELAGWDYEARRLDVLAHVTKAFVRLLEIQERRALTGELARLAGHVLGTVAATVTAGAVSPVEEARARVALSRATIELAQLERELDAARADLAATWGAQRVTFERVQGDLRTAAPPPELDTLVTALPQNPDLARWATELEERKAALEVESARRIPSPTIRFGGRHYADNDDGALVAELGLPLPLFDRNPGGILEAERRLGKARAERVAAETGVRAQLAVAYQGLRAAYERAQGLERSAVPEAERAYRGAVDAYAKGRFRYLEVLDAQRTLFELRDEHLRALADYHTAAAELERLTGTALPAVRAEAVAEERP